MKIGLIGIGSPHVGKTLTNDYVWFVLTCIPPIKQIISNPGFRDYLFDERTTHEQNQILSLHGL